VIRYFGATGNEGARPSAPRAVGHVLRRKGKCCRAAGRPLMAPLRRGGQVCARERPGVHSQVGDQAR
jgi:hypothetical protein